MPYLGIAESEPADVIRALYRVRGGREMSSDVLRSIMEYTRQEFLKVHANQDPGNISTIPLLHSINAPGFCATITIQPVGEANPNGRNFALTIEEIGVGPVGSYHKIPVHYMIGSPGLPLAENEMTPMSEALSELQRNVEEDTARGRIGSRFTRHTPVER